MQVGDLVKARDGDTGIILNIKYAHGAYKLGKVRPYWVTCLWSGGDIAGLGWSDIEVINASR